MPTEEDWHSHNPMSTTTYKLQTSIQQLYAQLVSIELASQEGASRVTGDVQTADGKKTLSLTLDGYSAQEDEYIKLYLAARDSKTKKLTHLLVMDQVGNKSASMVGLYSGKLYTLPENLDDVAQLTLADLTKLERIAMEKIPKGQRVPTFGGSLQRYS